MFTFLLISDSSLISNLDKFEEQKKKLENMVEDLKAAEEEIKVTSHSVTGVNRDMGENRDTG